MRARTVWIEKMVMPALGDGDVWIEKMVMPGLIAGVPPALPQVWLHHVENLQGASLFRELPHTLRNEVAWNALSPAFR